MITVAELKKQRAACNHEFLNHLDTEIQVLNKKGKLKYRADLTDAVDVIYVTAVLESCGFKVEHIKGDGGYGCLYERPYNYLHISWE